MTAGGRGCVFGVVAVFAAAFAVAAAVKRAPPDFSALPVIATLRDATDQPLWTIRLAPRARRIALDATGVVPRRRDHAYQLWLAAPAGPHSLGLLPQHGRKIVAETPAATAALAGSGRVFVSLEPERGSPLRRPSGKVAFATAFPGAH